MDVKEKCKFFFFLTKHKAKVLSAALFKSTTTLKIQVREFLITLKNFAVSAGKKKTLIYIYTLSH